MYIKQNNIFKELIYNQSLWKSGIFKCIIKYICKKKVKMWPCLFYTKEKVLYSIYKYEKSKNVAIYFLISHNVLW